MHDHFCSQQPQRRLWPVPGHWRGAHRLLALLLILAGIFVASVRPAYAAAITADGTDCTLIEAITSANNDNAAGNGCANGSGADTITLTADVPLTAVNNTNAYGGNGLPEITSAITIEGAGHTINRTNTAPAFRFFYVANNGTLALNRLTLHNGNTATDGGGAIWNLGTATVSNSTFAANTASYGSAIYTDGTVTVSNSTFATNTATSIYGGAIMNLGTATVSHSTFAANTATGLAGAILNLDTAMVSNSTFAANTASYGGAIANTGTATVSNSTFAANTASNSGGAIWQSSGGLTLHRNLISGNRAPLGAEFVQDGGTVTSVTNLWGESSQSNAQAFRNFTPDATDRTATNGGTTPTALARILNPTLADNGGPTWTHALVAGSPALDAAGDSGLATDQRGVARPQGCADDIGAFELEAVGCPTPEIDLQGNNVSIANGDSTPATADHTNVGSVVVNSGTVVRTFTIRNIGSVALTLSGSPLVNVTGNSAFTVSRQPASSVAAGGSTTFQLTFAPSAAGMVTTTVSIANNDSNEHPYTFVVQGEGIIANVQFQGVACDLIDAITAANNNIATGSCPAGSSLVTDIITLIADVPLTAVNNTNPNGSNGLPVITSAITIEGTGHTINRANTASVFRFFYVQNNGTLTLNRLTLHNGNTTRFGGAIWNGGTVTVSNSTFSTNVAAYDGGAIFTAGTATVSNSTFAANTASRGGAIWNAGTVTVSNSTFAANTATAYGGAIDNFDTATVSNSTFAANTATYGGGAISNNDTATVSNSTFSTNTTTDRGGAILNNGGLTLHRNLISGNRAASGAEFYQYSGTVTSVANLWGESSQSNGQAFTNFTPDATDRTATSNGTTPTALTAILNPTLANNGGNTQTYALVTCSPALDAAGDSGFDTDQRGIARPQGSADDIGAFELVGVRCPTPEIDLRGNSVSIANSDNTPATADHTDFGSVAVNSGTVVRTFTISNTGTDALTLSGSPLVNVTGNSVFTVSRQPASSVAAGGSTTFQLTFAPSAAGMVTATVSIANNDSDETPYAFVVGGTGIVPNAQLNGVACDLIDAITAANSDAASGSCPAGNGADTITLTADVTLTAVNNSEGVSDNGLPQIVSEITVEGNGHTISRANAAPTFRFFHVGNTGTLILNRLTLHNGKTAYGGAIQNNGTATVSNSTFAANTATVNGGAIQNGGGTATVSNSTFAANTASNSGGAIYNRGGLTLHRNLISGNRAASGAEFYQHSGTVTSVTNLWGESSRSNGQAFTNFTPNATDLTATSNGTMPTALTAILNPTLTNNSGGTWTHALVTGSPALDAAGDSGFATDQRGVARPQGCADDIGAFELEGVGCPAPEIDLRGNNVSIASGDSTPATADHTDFGSVAVNSGTVVRTFTISNTGTAALTLNGSPLVNVTGNSAFSVSSQPASSSVAAGGSTTFQLTFAPSAAGMVTATVSITNNDSDEHPYTFVVQGEGIIANVQFQGVACDLIDAITAANNNTATGSCPAGSSLVTDIITLTADVPLTAVNNTNAAGDNGLPEITSAITIEGAGHTINRANTAPAFRFFSVANNGTLTLNRLTLHNGKTASYGGAIMNDGTATVSNSTFAANTATYSGGAIFNNGTATVSNSTFAANTASHGGAIWNDGTATVSHSTFATNTASQGGGAIWNRGTVTVSHSTFAANTATYDSGAIANNGTAMVSNSTFAANTASYGGAILNNGTATVSNSTFAANTATYGGGAIWQFIGGLTLHRNLISGNRAPSGAEFYQGGGTVTSMANLWGESSQSNGQAFRNFTPDATDITATSNGTMPTALTAILNPTLADNGGNTQTYALVTCSPALDAAGDSGFATDQRGATRPQGTADDIGAFELEGVGCPTPEIDLRGNGVSIANGDSSPTATDHTAFGSVAVNSGTVVRTFTIRNTGTGALTLGGSPLVNVTGNSAFTVSSQPASSSVAAAGSTTFQLTFAPTISGTFTATVSIASNDSDETPYAFVVGGTGIVPNAQLNGVACDLIDAITAANSDAASGSCPAGNGADTITFTADVTLAAVNNTSALGSNSLPVITSAITIEGAGHTINRANAAPTFRFFHVGTNGTLTLNRLTLHNGNTAYGGAILNYAGTATVSNSTFSANTATANYGGGAILNYAGTATVSNSTFSANTATGSGGAILNLDTATVSNSTFAANTATDGGAIDNNGTATVSNSTFSGNTATYGGAINGRATVSNSTFSANTARFNGGAIFTDGTATVSNSTFAANTATYGGGAIWQFIGGLTLHRNLISGNRAPSGAEFYQGGGTVTSMANLWGESSQSNGQAFTNFTPDATDLTATNDGTHPTALTAILNPTLADNEGNTQTHALVTCSPALDAAGDSGFATDQRGVARPQGSADDIGAFELEAVGCPAPEIDLRGNNVSIANGDSTPATADHTAFGSVAVNSGTVVRTFTISNTGAGALTLSGSPLVNVTGNSAFSVSSQPASSSVAAGGNTTFAVTFAPTISGTITATVSIVNNDSDETPYAFVVQGTAAGQIDRDNQVTQADYTAVYQATPQSCANQPAPGLPIHTLTPTLRNNTNNSYQGLYFVVTELGYTAAQGGNVPTLCNADGGNGGGVGARVTATDAVLGDGFNPNERFAQAFQVGLPVRARYRLFVNLYARPATVTAAEQGADNAADLLGVLTWEFDENGNLITSRQLFLPLVAN